MNNIGIGPEILIWRAQGTLRPSLDSPSLDSPSLDSHRRAGMPNLFGGSRARPEPMRASAIHAARRICANGGQRTRMETGLRIRPTSAD